MTADELEEIFNPDGNMEVDEKVWMDLINEVDQNGDGKVIFYFFVKKTNHNDRFLIKNLKI